MKWLNRILSKPLPPVEQRGFFWPGFQQMRMTKDRPDGYIYYLAFKWSVIVSFLLGLLNWISYVYQVRFDFLLFDIDLPQRGFVRTFIWSYPFYTGAFLLFAVVPFFYTKLKRHVDVRTFDSAWWNDQLDTSDYKLMIRKFRLALYLTCFAMLVGTPFPAEVLMDKLRLFDSYNFFLSWLLIYPFLFGYLALSVLTSLVVLTNYKARHRAARKLESRLSNDEEEEDWL